MSDLTKNEEINEEVKHPEEIADTCLPSKPINDGKGAGWGIYQDKEECPIVYDLKDERIYYIMNFSDSNWKFGSIKIRKEHKIITLPADKRHECAIFNGGVAIIEAKNLSLLIKTDKPDRGFLGQYDIVCLEPETKYNGRWTINGELGPCLIADLNEPKNFRLYASEFQPTDRAKSYKLLIYVDKGNVPLDITSTNSVDVYGKHISIYVKNVPEPTKPFFISGAFQVWD